MQGLSFGNVFWAFFSYQEIYKIGNENTVVSVSVSVSAETENHFRFRYRFRQKRNMAISARFGFGRNKKRPFGRALDGVITTPNQYFSFLI